MNSFEDALAEHVDSVAGREVERFAAALGNGVVEPLHESRDAWFAAPPRQSFEYAVRQTRSFERGAALALVDVTYQHSPQTDPARFLLSLLFERDGNGSWTFASDQRPTNVNAAVDRRST